MKLSEVKKIIKKNQEQLRSEFHVSALFVFGSVAVGKSSKKSDVDLLVEFSSDEVGMFDFVKLKFFLESILNNKVDLVTRDAIKQRMAARISRESIRVA